VDELGDRLATTTASDESKQDPEDRIHNVEQHQGEHDEPDKRTGLRFLSPTSRSGPHAMEDFTKFRLATLNQGSGHYPI